MVNIKQLNTIKTILSATCIAMLFTLMQADTIAQQEDGPPPQKNNRPPHERQIKSNRPFNESRGERRGEFDIESRENRRPGQSRVQRDFQPREIQTEVNEAETIAFLEKHLPKMVTRLSELKTKDNGMHKYQQQLLFINRLYSSAMRHFKSDSPNTTLFVNRTTLRLKLERLIKNAHKNEIDATKNQDKTKKLIESTLSEMFDTIIAIEENRLASMSQISKDINIKTNAQGNNKEKNKAKKADNKQPVKTQARKDKPNKKGFQGDRLKRGAPGDQLHHNSNLEELQENIALWKGKKAQLITQKIEEIFHKAPSFPWGR